MGTRATERSSRVVDEKRLEAGPIAASSASDEKTSAVRERLKTLELADAAGLRTEWRRLLGTEPPRLSRDLLVRALAYQVQVRFLGGLSRASLRRLEAADEEGATGPSKPDPTTLRPGTRLVREWHGRTHVVTATETGFDYAGSQHDSLTQIAKLITGAHWSGPRFFGLTSRVVAGRADV